MTGASKPNGKMRGWGTWALVLSLFLLLRPSSEAMFPITIGSVELHWGSGDIPVTYVIQNAGATSISDDSEKLAIRLAFDRWQNVSAPEPSEVQP